MASGGFVRCTEGHRSSVAPHCCSILTIPNLKLTLTHTPEMLGLDLLYELAAHTTILVCVGVCDSPSMHVLR